MIKASRLAVVLLSLLPCFVMAGVTEIRAGRCGGEGYLGRPLAQALEDLEACGLKIIYSSDHVRPDMVIEVEPAGASPRQILDALLAPHGLTTLDGPGGRVLIVSSDAATAPTGGIEGRLVTRPDRLPVPRARVRLVGQEVETISARDGTFRLDGIARGVHDLDVYHGGVLLERFRAVQVQAGTTTYLQLKVPLNPAYIEEVTVTPSRYKIAEDEPESRQRVFSETLQRTPTVGGDAHRAVSHLPGMASGDRSAQLSIRGGNPNEVLFVLDGLEILDPFHLKAFQSFSGIVDSRAIGKADILTGSFPAEYGDRMSGVVDLSSSSPSGDGQTVMGANFYNSHFLSNGRFGAGNGQWLLSARAWYPDVVNEVITPTGEDIEPNYLDVLGKVQVQVGDSTTLSGNLLMSNDVADFKEVEEDQTEGVTARSHSEYAWISLDSAWTPRLFSHTHFSTGRISAERKGFLRGGEEEAMTRVRDERSFDIYGLRQDWSFRASELMFLKFGLEAKRVTGKYDYFAAIPDRSGILDEDVPPTASERTTLIEPSGDELGAYVSGRFNLSSPLTVEVGARWDQQSHTSEDQLSPRINVLYAWGSRSAFRAGWGRFYQSQGINELQVEDGVSDFHPAQLSEHRVVSFEHNFTGGLHLRINAYSKEISNLRPWFENLFDPIELFPEAEPDRVRIAPDRAKAEGVELFLKSASGDRLNWWTSYSLSSVEDEIDGEMVPRSWDQRHAFNFGLNYRPTPKWSFDLAGIYHTGWPTTAVRAEMIESEDGSLEIQPLLGPRNSERFSAYHRLDVRASRHILLDRGRLTFYLEVLNVYDQKNPCCVDEFLFTPRPDGSVGVSREDDYWLARLPTLGVVWELRR